MARLFSNSNENIVLKIELKSPKTHWALKKKKKKRKRVTSSGICDCVITNWRRKSTLVGITFKGSGVGGLVSSHFLVYLFKIKVLQIHSRGVLDEVSPQELKPFEVLAEEHSIVLFSLLESLNSFSSYGLDLLLGS